MATSPSADDLYKAYLEEMQSLENFRVSYTSVQPRASIDREDPEVRRLIDAMAFLTARTRTSALRNLLATQRRLFQQYFSFLVSPMPAMGMVQAVTSGKFAEPVTLPRNTEVLITPEGRQGALFRTMSELRILPLRIEDLTMLLRSKAGYRVVISFTTPFPRNDDLGTLPLFVTHLDDYPASLGVLHNLRKHLEQATIVFDEDRIDDLTEGTPCEVSYGALGDPDDLPDLSHPLQLVRQFFHYPNRELFLNVQVPPGARNWKRFSICLDLDADWPKSLRLNKDMFQLSVVPIWNLNRSMAEPINFDGVKNRFPLRYPSAPAKFALHSVVGVYEVLKKGMAPLKPGMVTGGNGSYEIERTVEDTGPVNWVKLQFPEALQTPKKIAVDAFWIQPWFSRETTSKLKVAFHSRNLIGVQLELRGETRVHSENPLQNDFEGMLQVLALKSKVAGYNQDDVGALLNALGTVHQGQFRELLGSIDDVSVRRLPGGKERGGGQLHTYRIKLKELDAAMLPVIAAGLGQVAKMLKAWTTDADVKVEVVLGGSDDKLEI